MQCPSGTRPSAVVVGKRLMASLALSLLVPRVAKTAQWADNAKWTRTFGLAGSAMMPELVELIGRIKPIRQPSRRALCPPGEPSEPRPIGSSGTSLYGSGADEASTGNEFDEVVSAEMFGARWPFGNDDVARLGIGITDIDGHILRHVEVELSEDAAWISDNARLVRLTLVPRR